MARDALQSSDGPPPAVVVRGVLVGKVKWAPDLESDAPRAGAPRGGHGDGDLHFGRHLCRHDEARRQEDPGPGRGHSGGGPSPEDPPRGHGRSPDLVVREPDRRGRDGRKSPVDVVVVVVSQLLDEPRPVL